MILQNTLPSIGVGRLRLLCDDSQIYGTDKEHSVRLAEDPFYKQMAVDQRHLYPHIVYCLYISAIVSTPNLEYLAHTTKSLCAVLDTGC